MQDPRKRVRKPIEIRKYLRPAKDGLHEWGTEIRFSNGTRIHVGYDSSLQIWRGHAYISHGDGFFHSTHLGSPLRKEVFRDLRREFNEWKVPRLKEITQKLVSEKTVVIENRIRPVRSIGNPSIEFFEVNGAWK